MQVLVLQSFVFPKVTILDVRNNVSTTSDSLLAAPAVPDADGLTLDGDLSAECAGVAGVLGNFHLLHLLPQGGTISVEIVRLMLLSLFGSLRSFFAWRRDNLSLSSHSRGVCIPGTVFTGDTDLCQIVSCYILAR